MYSFINPYIHYYTEYKDRGAYKITTSSCDWLHAVFPPSSLAMDDFKYFLYYYVICQDVGAPRDLNSAWRALGTGNILLNKTFYGYVSGGMESH